MGTRVLQHRVIGGVATSLAVLLLCGCAMGRTTAQVSASLDESTGDPVPSGFVAPTAVGAGGAQLGKSGVKVTVPAGTAVGEELVVTVGDDIGPVRSLFANERFGAPVRIGHKNPLGASVDLTWDVSMLTAAQQATLTLVRWDELLHAWRASSEPVSVVNGRLTVAVRDFSTVDWAANLAASITQIVGEAAGARAPAPTCSSAALPAWVQQVIRPDENQPAMPIRTCVQPDKDGILTVRVSNNRPYTQLLTVAVTDQQYAWTWLGEKDYTVAGLIRDGVDQALTSTTNLAMAPTRATAVGLARPVMAGPVTLKLTARPTVSTVAADILQYLFAHAFDLDGVGGFDSDMVNGIAQLIYDCGGKKLLQSRDLSLDAAGVGEALDTLKQCVANDTVQGGIQQLLRTQIAQGGKTAGAAIVANRVMSGALRYLEVFVEVATLSSYTAELVSSGAIGDVTVSVFATGTPNTLGQWSPTCSDADKDSAALYKNLATQDAFYNHQSEDLWRLPAWQPSAVQAVRPLTRCTPTQRGAVAHNVETTWADMKSAAMVATEVRALTPPSTTGATTTSAPPTKCAGDQALYDQNGSVIEAQITPDCTSNRRGAVFQLDMEHPFWIAKWGGTRWMLVWVINAAPKCVGIDDLLPGVTAAELSKLMYGFCDGIR